MMCYMIRRLKPTLHIQESNLDVLEQTFKSMMGFVDISSLSSSKAQTSSCDYKTELCVICGAGATHCVFVIVTNVIIHVLLMLLVVMLLLLSRAQLFKPRNPSFTTGFQVPTIPSLFIKVIIITSLTSAALLLLRCSSGHTQTTENN